MADEMKDEMDSMDVHGDLFEQEPSKVEKMEVSSAGHLPHEIPIATTPCVAATFLVPFFVVAFSTGST